MVAFERDLDTFFTKSTQLIQVFPSARCTTKYRKINESQSLLTVKTYDPTSGAIVKFKTDKTVDLGRLLVGNTTLSHSILGTVQVTQQDVDMVDSDDKVDAAQDGSAAEEAVTTTATTTATKKKNKKKKGKK